MSEESDNLLEMIKNIMGQFKRECSYDFDIISTKFDQISDLLTCPPNERENKYVELLTRLNARNTGVSDGTPASADIHTRVIIEAARKLAPPSQSL